MTTGSPRHRQQLRRMQAAAVVAEVGDLVAAAEAGGDDQVIGRRAADRGEKHALAAGLAHLVVALPVAEACRRPATHDTLEVLCQESRHVCDHLTHIRVRVLIPFTMSSFVSPVGPRCNLLLHSFVINASAG